MEVEVVFRAGTSAAAGWWFSELASLLISRLFPGTFECSSSSVSSRKEERIFSQHRLSVSCGRNPNTSDAKLADTSSGFHQPARVNKPEALQRWAAAAAGAPRLTRLTAACISRPHLRGQVLPSWTWWSPANRRHQERPRWTAPGCVPRTPGPLAEHRANRGIRPPKERLRFR